MGTVLAPVFEGDKLRANEDIAASRRDQAAFAYRKATLSAFQEIEDAYSDVTKLADKERAAIAQSQDLAAALRAAQRRFDHGYSSYREVLDAERGLLASQLSGVQARADRLTALVKLYQAIGAAGRGRQTVRRRAWRGCNDNLPALQNAAGPGIGHLLELWTGNRLASCYSGRVATCDAAVQRCGSLPCSSLHVDEMMNSASPKLRLFVGLVRDRGLATWFDKRIFQNSHFGGWLARSSQQSAVSSQQSDYGHLRLVACVVVPEYLASALLCDRRRNPTCAQKYWIEKRKRQQMLLGAAVSTC